MKTLKIKLEIDEENCKYSAKRADSLGRQGRSFD